MTKKKKISDEERIQGNLKYNLDRLREEYSGDPTVSYIQGSRIQYGNHNHTVITEVIDGGKIYKITNTSATETAEAYVSWIRIEPYRSKEYWEQTEQAIHQSKNWPHLSFSQRHVDGLLNAYYNFGIDTNPEYQRELVWDLEDKVCLIDSIFNEVDIGKFVLCKKPWKAKSKSYEILDGKQRLTTLVEFHEGRFGYKGKLFRDMHPHDRNHFENYGISWAELNEPTEKEKYLTFLRLNTGGRPQNQEHLDKVTKLLKGSK